MTYLGHIAKLTQGKFIELQFVHFSVFVCLEKGRKGTGDYIHSVSLVA